MSASQGHAQMCSPDAGCDDAGEPFDSGTMPMDGAVPEEDDAGPMAADGGPADAGWSDASVGDAGFDAGEGGESVAACSCESALNNEGSIHVCTGSFDRATCGTFSCELGVLRSERCPESEVLLCCTMKARRLYTHLYKDCEHPNCEAGFRAQCADFGGEVTKGACESPDLPDDPDTQVGSICSVATPGRSEGGWTPWGLLLAALGVCVSRRARRLRDVEV